ncbi:MAG: hypothetical protein CVV30_10330 [Methanomicrobiales archaeon HGW-Methanomicrobiales-1]|jgi:CheY-like chemotaxis protein/DNA-binding PadR family transcriptional regulator|nr:MAG: hypothetical protein CVV30_10330 [Methanomicrobiales archaeon HGW-Methanomicrobiales-1]
MDHVTILVVEDEVIVSMDLLHILETMHYSPLCAVRTGDEAVVKAREKKPDVVLMDINIPGTMDGLDAAGIIREELGIPVIFVTSYSDDAIIEQAKHVNPYGYVIKPFTERNLKVAIEIALSRKAAELQDRLSEPPAIPAGLAETPVRTGCPHSSLSDIRTLFVKGFFHDVALLIYSNSEIKEQVFASFIERNLKTRGDLFFAYSFSRAHRNFLSEIQNGKIRVCRIKAGELAPLREILSDVQASSGSAYPVPLKLLIDFSERYEPEDILAVVDQVIAVRKSGVPVSGIIALDSGMTDDILIKELSEKIPGVVAATSYGTLISCADQSFPLESLSFLPQTVVDETVKKILEPVVLSLLEKPISGYNILKEIRGRYNLSVPKARVYTQLYDLQKKGYLSVSTIGKSKVYSPTETGKLHIRQKLDEFRSVFYHILAEMADQNGSSGFPKRKE